MTAASPATVVLVALVIVPGAVVAYRAVTADDFSTEGALDDREPWELWVGNVLGWGAVCVVFGAVVALGATVGSLSPSTVGLGRAALPQVCVGLVAGVGLFALGRAVAALCAAAGVSSEGGIAHLMEPETTAGIIGFAGATVVESTGEEIGFRAVLIGALAAVLGASPWWLVAPAGVVFGVAHATEGDAAVVVATVVGIGFGAVFVSSGLTAAAAAHAAMNVAELLAVMLMGWDHVYAPS